MSSQMLMFGDFIQTHKFRKPISRLELSLMPLDLIVQWRRCGMTADYMASYLAYHFADPERAMNVLSTVLNELVENSVKFSADKSIPISLVASFFGAVITLQATNSASSDRVEHFKEFINRLLTEDAEELFLSRIEDTAVHNLAVSGLGLITIKKDYLSGMGARITPLPDSGGLYAVTVQLHLDADLVDRH